jgi:hypothetical protein
MIELPEALLPPSNDAALSEQLGGFFGLPDGKCPTRSVTLASNGADGAVSARKQSVPCAERQHG